jgi:HlyD family type I secretion membrane fusion protein
MTLKDVTAAKTLQSRFMDPGKPARIGLLVIAFFVLVMLGWGAVAPLSGAVVASGVLQVEGGRQSVQHPYGGVVARILVAEGNRVEQGAVLMELSDTEPRAQLDVLSAERDALLAAQGRLVAERDGADAPKFPETLLARANEPGAQEAMTSETTLMAARTRQYQTSRDVLEQRRLQLDERVTAAEAQIRALTEQRGSVNEELEDARILLADQLIQRNRVTELERRLSDTQAQIEVLQSEIATANKAMTEADFEIAGLERTRVTEVTEAIRANQAALNALAPKIGAATDALSRTTITAPAGGQVVGLQMVTQGGVIAAGQTILDIVPQDNPLLVEAQLRLADISDVERGSTADIRLLSVPATSRPELKGSVETVSADRIEDERTGQSYYGLRIALDHKQVAASGLDLQAGMPVQIIIPTRGRTMIDYLVSPLLDEVNGAFREP